MSFFDPVDAQRLEIRSSIEAGDEKIRNLMSKTARRFTAGESLVDAGCSHQFVYRVRSGWTGRVRMMPDGRSQYILIFLPGDLFAVKSMFVRQHPDSIEALSDSIVEQIDQKDLIRAYSSDSEIAMRCTWQIVEEERRLHNWVVSLGRGSVQERLAALILQFRSRLALAGAIEMESLIFDIPMTQQQLADHLGVSLVHLNKSLRRIREEGLLTIRGRTFEILDWAGLAEIAMPILDAMEAASRQFVGPTIKAMK